MTIPLTLAGLGSIALSEGVKFLYSQAGELLKRWRDRHDKAAQSTTPPAQTEPADVTLPAVFQGQLEKPTIHHDALEKAEEPLRALRKDLSDYADDIEPIDPKNPALLEHIDALRRLLEAVYQQPLTFVGEDRAPADLAVGGKIDVGTVVGYAAAVRARTIKSGNIHGEARADRVEQGGQLIGVDVDTIG
jgi:hypothetical protein